MVKLDATLIVGLVEAIARVRAITDVHPELRPVAVELLEMPGPLPLLGTVVANGESPVRLSTAPVKHQRKRVGLHWTQRPENRNKVRRMLKAAQRARKG